MLAEQLENFSYLSLKPVYYWISKLKQRRKLTPDKVLIFDDPEDPIYTPHQLKSIELKQLDFEAPDGSTNFRRGLINALSDGRITPHTGSFAIPYCPEVEDYWRSIIMSPSEDYRDRSIVWVTKEDQVALCLPVYAGIDKKRLTIQPDAKIIIKDDNRGKVTGLARIDDRLFITSPVMRDEEGNKISLLVREFNNKGKPELKATETKLLEMLEPHKIQA